MSSTLKDEGEASPGVPLSQREGAELAAFAQHEQSWEEDAAEWDEELVPMESLKEESNMEKAQTRKAVSQLLDQLQEEIRHDKERELIQDSSTTELRLSRPWDGESSQAQDDDKERATAKLVNQGADAKASHPKAVPRRGT